MTYIKDPDAILDYTVDWRNWLQVGESITSVAWNVPAGITNSGVSNDAQSATIWLSGGTAGTSYSIRCRIATDGGRTDDRSFTVVAQER